MSTDADGDAGTGSPFDRLLAALALDRGALLYAAVALNTELLVVLAYVALVLGGRVRRPLFLVYPFVWLNAAAYAVYRVRRERPSAATSRRERAVAALVAAGYLAILSYAGGLVGPGGTPATGLRVVLLSLPPGWAPAVVYGGETVRLALVPFQVVGYAVLAYLAYVTALDAAAGLVGGLLGLFSCVSCALPVVAGVVSGLVGGGGALAAAIAAQSYALSTVVYVATVALLLWRPTLADLAFVRDRDRNRGG